VINVWIRTFFIPIRTYEFIEQAASAQREPRGRSPSCERAARAARAKPEHTSCPDQAAPGCPDVRVHPAAPTLGYTRLPRPVRVRSWGGWVRNGIKITIQKLRLYKFIRPTFSQPLFLHYFMRIIGVKVSIHITNFTLIVVHVPFAAKSRFYVIFVLYFVVYVTIGNYYYLNTLFMYGFCCAPPLQSLFLAICTHFTWTSLPVMLHPQCWYPYTSHNRIISGSTRH